MRSSFKLSTHPSISPPTPPFCQVLVLGPAAAEPPGLSRNPLPLKVEPIRLSVLLQVSDPARDQLVPEVPTPPDPVHLSPGPSLRLILSLYPSHARPTLPPPGLFSRAAQPPRTNPTVQAEPGPCRAGLTLLLHSQDHSLRPPGVKVTEALRVNGGRETLEGLL